MPLIERVAQLREQQRRDEGIAIEEEAKVREAATKAQEQARATNLRAFNKFEQELGLKKSLVALAESEGLQNYEIEEWIEEPAAVVVKLRLKWQGKSKSKRQERVGVIVSPSKGFFSISVRWAEGGVFTVSGEKVVGSSHAALFDNGANMEDFEELVARAYLNPRWNEQHNQPMLSGGKLPLDPDAWPPELREK